MIQRLAAILTLGAACASESVEPPPAVPVDWRSINAPPPVASKGPTVKESALAPAYVASLASPKLDALGPMLDETSHAAFGHHDARGRDKVVKLHEELFGAFDERKTAVGRWWRTDDVQVVEWVMTGTQAREWMGVVATQKPVVIRGIVCLWTQDVGTITDVHLYFSVPVVKAELGVGPKELQDYVATVQPLPAPTAPTLDQDDTPAEKENEKVVRDMLDAFEHGKEADFMAAYADNVEVDALSRPKTDKKDDVRTYYRTMRRSIGQLDTTVVSLTAVKNYVLLENLISGEQFAPVGYTPTPSDHAAWIEMADVIEMTADHKILHIWRYGNPDWPQDRL